MERTFQTLNELETAGLVTRYAIDGAFAMNPRLQELAEASFQQKKERRRELAALPIEEKVEILRLLQKMTVDIAWEVRGVKLEPWPAE